MDKLVSSMYRSLNFGFRTVINRGQINEKLEDHENIEKLGVRHVQMFKIVDLEQMQQVQWNSNQK